MDKPFDLEAFKSGQKALTRDGRVATFIGICNKCDEFYKLIVKLENETHVRAYHLSGRRNATHDLVSMVSRHQHLIDAWHNGASIEGRLTPYSEWIDLPHPSWHEDMEYRIKSEITKPTTKTVYEWLLKNHKGNCWSIGELLMTEDEVALYYDGYAKMKTGRSWEVEA